MRKAPAGLSCNIRSLNTKANQRNLAITMPDKRATDLALIAEQVNCLLGETT